MYNNDVVITFKSFLRKPRHSLIAQSICHVDAIFLKYVSLVDNKG